MKSKFDLNTYIEHIELNGLNGRMVNAPARDQSKKHVNILFIHGHHSSLERLAGVADLMMDYGNFCLPDMPGFGGMDHLYQIDEKPTIDNLADYMAAFVKLHYGTHKKFIMVGYSFGFLVATRMLQKYPSLQKQCITSVGIAGLLHQDDIVFTKKRRLFYYISSKIIGTLVISWVTRELFLRKWFLGSFYARSHNAKSKFMGLSSAERQKIADFEVHLWRVNHVPTWCYTTREMLRADLVNGTHQITTPLVSVTIDADQYFDSAVVEQHMYIAYETVRTYKATADKHGGSVIETAKDALPYFPKQLRTYLKELR